MGDELKDKIGQFFDIETYMCRVICSKFSPEIKMKWSIEGSESVITMSLKSINRIQKILLEIYMHKSTLRNLQGNFHYTQKLTNRTIKGSSFQKNLDGFSRKG